MKAEVQNGFLSDEEMWEIDQRAVRKYAFKKGFAEGYAQGLAESLPEWKVNIVKKMLANRLTPEAISNYTNLTIEQIKALF